MMIKRIVWDQFKPKERPASICPLSIDWIPPRNISAIYALLLILQATIAAIKGSIRVPIKSGQGKIDHEDLYQKRRAAQKVHIDFCWNP